jgi:hypothetical protein
MSRQEFKRKLTAVFNADAAGHSWLMREGHRGDPG